MEDNGKQRKTTENNRTHKNTYENIGKRMRTKANK